MTSYLSSLTTHYNSIKRLLPTHLSPDADNSINDASDSHVSRVLRAYYTEKGRTFPQWLGPDPNAPVRPPASYVSSQRQSSGPAMAAAVSSVKRGGLGDLFGDSPSPQAQPQQEEPLSLRSRRGAFKAQTPAAAAQPTPVAQPTARPLPSQRQGSYQNRSNDSGNSVTQPVMREQTAQERLRARLGGSRGASPAATPSPGANFDNRSGDRGGSGYNPYENSGGGGFNPYESNGNRGGGGSGFNPYETSSTNPYSSSSNTQRPYASSNSPWTTGDDPADIGTGAGRRGAGLPGLPSNPRSRR